MEIKLILDSKLPEESVQLQIHTAKLTPDVQQLIQQLELLGSKNDIIPIKQEDSMIMLKPETIIWVEVNSSTLFIYTKERVYQTKERLNRFNEKLVGFDFVQVSKHAIINLNHLISLENSFSGNMLAILSNDFKTDVSRKYLGLLKRKLGI